MTDTRSRSIGRQAGFQASALGLLLIILAACSGSDGVGPSSESPAPILPSSTDSVTPTDSAAVVPTDSTLPADSTIMSSADSLAAVGAAGLTTLTGSTAPGIVFGSFDLDNTLLGTVHTGSLRSPGPTSILWLLSGARAKAARLVLKLTGGSNGPVKNGDGTFSFTKWKALLDGFKTVNFSSYLTDGTILGHYLIDEPWNPAKWGGKVVSQATVEAMAKYSKQLWPGLATFVRAPPRWLAQAPITYIYLDAGWAQYASYHGDLATWITAEVAAAKSKRLGLIVGLNALDGGNGSSGIRGSKSGNYAMSASELRSYGTTLLNQSYACGFIIRTYNSTYYGRTDIKSAMADLSLKAKAHAKTSCQQ